MTRLLLLTAWLVVAAGCGASRWYVRAIPRCADGLPAEILADPACPPDGVCGYSCLPGRWRKPRGESR